jgi:hypothetical protein
MKMLTHDKHQHTASEYKCALDMVLDLARFNLNPTQLERANNVLLNSFRLRTYPNARVMTKAVGRWF